MPRGPGKKENYNLDYSRFGFLEKENDEDQVVVVPPKAAAEKPKPSADDNSDMPPVRDMLRQMPAELQQAFHLMSIAKETGDAAAQKKANELAMKAVKQGGPQVQRDFIKTIAGQAPELTRQLGIDPEKEIKNPEAVLKKLLGEAPEPGAAPQEDDFDVKVDTLRTHMMSGAEQARKQLEALEKQQQMLESMKSPEDIIKFMQEGGMGDIDVQRIFGGDQAHMEECVKGMLDKATDSVGGGKGNEATEAALKAADSLHRTICGNGGADDLVDAEPPATEAPKPAKRLPPEPPAREVKVPMYRMQYQKSPEGKYIGVELSCTLPGITAMADIVLDVSRDHMRLTTAEHAPGYAVNAGPFPVPIDPGAARAKFSKKREELLITVPAEGV